MYRTALAGCFCLLSFLQGSILGEMVGWQDTFQQDTTNSYDLRWWPFYGSSGTSLVLDYDAANERGVLHANGGYGWSLMSKQGYDTIPVYQDFRFSADLQILAEYNGALYMGDTNGNGDNRDTYMTWRLDTYVDSRTVSLQVVSQGNPIVRQEFSWLLGNANLAVERNGSDYSFFLNNELMLTREIPELDGLPLLFGVQHAISSGPSGWTAKTAIDNLEFTPIPEPATLSLLALGGLALIPRRK